ncbi:MAG TPA: Gfo/Idh/MocA family oxidoreductase [Actinomycetota bacterium]|nr:Gfo/Idh/MocA family oxidoreductase [Actinomycetota bacterium]
MAIRVGLVGFGLGGAVFHAPLIDATAALSLDAIVTTHPERVARARERYPSARVLPDVDALLSSADELDLVVVTTPNRSHVAIALGAVEAGLHVVMDKPIAPSSVDARGLATAAADRGVLLSVFQNRRWDADFLTVRRLLEGDALGRVVRLESRFERWDPALGGGWRELGAPEEGGGMLLDLGSHLVDQAIQLLGPPISVYAEVGRRRPGAEADDDAFVALVHPGGVRSHLWMSLVAGALGPRFRVLGLGGTFEVHGLDPQEQQLKDGMVPGDDRYGIEPPERWGAIIRGGKRESVPTERGDYPRYYAQVADAIERSGPPPVPAEDAILGLEVLEAARRSAETGTVVRLST